MWYSSEPYKDYYYLYVRPIWPTETKKDKINEKDLRSFIEKEIDSDIKKGYITVEVTSHNRAIVKFNSSKWLKENFLESPRVKFNIPRTLEWSWKKRLPDTLVSHAAWNNIRKFLEKKFKEFLKDNCKRVFKKKLKVMKKVNYNWFIYEADLQWNKFIVKMKLSVMMTLAAAGYMAGKAIGKK